MFELAGIAAVEVDGVGRVLALVAADRLAAHRRTAAAITNRGITVVRHAARASVGPVYAATPNPGCGHCALAASCPAQIRGKAVTDD